MIRMLAYIHPLVKFFFGTYCVPATVLSAKSTVLNKTDTGPVFLEKLALLGNVLNQIVDHMFQYTSGKCYGKQGHEAHRAHNKQKKPT